jgi:hypothetical protein
VRSAETSGAIFVAFRSASVMVVQSMGVSGCEYVVHALAWRASDRPGTVAAFWCLASY